MPSPHALPKQRGLTVAVQLALTLAAGMYAPRIRAQQISCPSVSETVTGTAENSVFGCQVTGTLTIEAGGTLNNNMPLDNVGTLTNRGTLNGNEMITNATAIAPTPGTLVNEGWIN